MLHPSFIFQATCPLAMFCVTTFFPAVVITYLISKYWCKAKSGRYWTRKKIILAAVIYSLALGFFSYLTLLPPSICRNKCYMTWENCHRVCYKILTTDGLITLAVISLTFMCFTKNDIEDDIGLLTYMVFACLLGFAIGGGIIPF